MQKGPDGIDLSNEIPPRMIFVFDGLVGQIPLRGTKLAKFYRATGRWDRLARLYQFDKMALRHLHDLSWRRDWRLDCATFEPDGFCDALEERFSRENVAVANVYHYDGPLELARALAYMPEVYYVIHGDSSMPFTYGPRGHVGFEGL